MEEEINLKGYPHKERLYQTFIALAVLLLFVGIAGFIIFMFKEDQAQQIRLSGHVAYSVAEKILFWRKLYKTLKILSPIVGIALSAVMGALAVYYKNMTIYIEKNEVHIINGFKSSYIPFTEIHDVRRVGAHGLNVLGLDKIYKVSNIGNAGEMYEAICKLISMKNWKNRANEEANTAAANTVTNNISPSKDTVNKQATGTSIADELKELKSLLDDGIITEEEFDKKKKELLS